MGRRGADRGSHRQGCRHVSIDDDDLQPRLGTALAMAGKSDEAPEVFERYLDRHRADTARLFLALRLIYEGRAHGRRTRTLEEDRARFDEYAAITPPVPGGRGNWSSGGGIS